MRFTPIAVFGQEVESLPVSGALFRFEPTLYGSENPVQNGATAFGPGTVFLTDPIASSFPNNVAKEPAVRIQNLPTSENLGTIIWAWRYRESGSVAQPLGFNFLLDTRSGPNADPEQGIADGFVQIKNANVGTVYQSASMYNAYGNEDLQKFEINTDNLVTELGGNYNTGSQTFPGYYNNTITGSEGLVYADTGSNAYRFSAFSPNTAGTPIGSGSYDIDIFQNDAGSDQWYWANGPNVTPPDDFDANYNVFNIAAISVFNRVLSDSEVRRVLNYYTGSLGLEIGL